MSDSHATALPPCTPADVGAVRISVIIPTYRRKRHLLAVLDQLAQQSILPEEVLVIDSSPADERLFGSELEPYAPWLKYEIATADAGNVSRKRNDALRRSTGDVVVFLDDDVQFDTHMLADYVDALVHHTADVVGGVILLPGESPRSAPRARPPLLIDDPGAPNLQAYDGVRPSYVVCTASLCARREALVAIGGFDEQLSRLEDVELGLRLERAGYRVIHHNTPVVHHLVASASGARSADRGIEWMLPSLFYFQYRHFPARRRSWLLASTVWQFCRPSRHWLTPAVIVRRARGIVAAHREAAERVAAGPRLMR